MELKTEIGSRLRSFREQLGLSQKEFAKSLNVRSNVWSNYENGISFPPLPLLAVIHDLYGLNLDWLVSGKRNLQPVTDFGDLIELLVQLPDFSLEEIQNPEYRNAIEDIERTTGEPYEPSLTFNGVEELNTLVPSIVFNNEEIQKFLTKFDKIKSTLGSDEVDDELFNLWKEKEIKKHKGIKLKQIEPNSDDEYTERRLDVL